jgi:hypothetical protein
MSPDTAVPEVEVARWQAPRVSLTPVTGVIPSEPIQSWSDSYVGHYQSILLNVRSGALRFHESTRHREPWDPSWTAVNDVPRETWKRWHPGTLFTPNAQWFQPVPECLAWVIESGSSDVPYLEVSEANAHLERHKSC